MLLIPAAAAAQTGERIGTVKLVEGDVTIIRGEPITAAVGDLLLDDDTIATKEGSIGITLRDGTRISLGPNSRLSIADFQFDPVESRLGMLLRLLFGKLQYVSGKVAELAPESVKVETPVATVGVRGTRFVVEVPE